MLHIVQECNACGVRKGHFGEVEFQGLVTGDPLECVGQLSHPLARESASRSNTHR